MGRSVAATANVSEVGCELNGKRPDPRHLLAYQPIGRVCEFSQHLPFTKTPCFVAGAGRPPRKVLRAQPGDGVPVVCCAVPGVLRNLAWWWPLVLARTASMAARSVLLCGPATAQPRRRPVTCGSRSQRCRSWPGLVPRLPLGLSHAPRNRGTTPVRGRPWSFWGCKACGARTASRLWHHPNP